MPKQKKIALDRKKGLYLKDTRTAKGRGVFCVTKIPKGEVLEVTPALILNDSETAHADKTLLLNYTFMPGKLSKKLREKVGLKSHDNASSVVMGILSFCNHSEEPNAEILWQEENGTLYYILQATRAIPKDTEICTSYGGGWFDERK